MFYLDFFSALTRHKVKHLFIGGRVIGSLAVKSL
jgi:hypothetical protein